jgi:non-homologous end joining protein Ku
MPPARPFWKGYLKLSLVSCPIALFPASSSSERVSFRQINKPLFQLMPRLFAQHSFDRLHNRHIGI